jgi:hypothetical protein
MHAVALKQRSQTQKQKLVGVAMIQHWQFVSNKISRLLAK